MILIYRNSYGSVLLKHLISFILLSYSFFVAFVRNLFPSANFNIAIIDEYLTILSILFIVSVILATAFLIKNGELNIHLWFYVFSALMISAPFIAIIPYGPHCAFNTVCFIILATLDVINTYINELSFNAFIEFIRYLLYDFYSYYHGCKFIY